MPFFKKVYSLKAVDGDKLKNSIGVVSVTAENTVVVVNCFVNRLSSLSDGEYCVNVLNKSGKLLKKDLQSNFFVSAKITFDCDENFDDIDVVITATVSSKGYVVATTNVRYANYVQADNYFYDDEKIAEENYYLQEGFYERETNSNKDACLKEDTWTDKEKEKSKTCSSKDGYVFNKPNEVPFYVKNCGKITHKRLEKNLTKIVPNSIFYKMNDEKEWYLGTVNNDGVPAYVCYAVKANALKYSEVLDYADFVPASVFSSQEGYYLTYRDAVTGEVLKKEDVDRKF